MNDVNYVALSGEIVSPIELKVTRALNIPVVDFMLRTKPSDLDENFIPCQNIGSDAIDMSRECREGDHISLKGNIKSYQQRDRYGNTHSCTRVRILSYCKSEGKKKPDVSNIITDDL